MEEAMTGTEISMRLSQARSIDENQWQVNLIRKAVARALQNQDGHWRTDERRDARDVAEVACYFMVEELAMVMRDAKRAKEFAEQVFGAA